MAAQASRASNSASSGRLKTQAAAKPRRPCKNLARGRAESPRNAQSRPGAHLMAGQADVYRSQGSSRRLQWRVGFCDASEMACSNDAAGPVLSIDPLDFRAPHDGQHRAQILDCDDQVLGPESGRCRHDQFRQDRARPVRHHPTLESRAVHRVACLPARQRYDSEPVIPYWKAERKPRVPPCGFRS